MSTWLRFVLVAMAGVFTAWGALAQGDRNLVTSHDIAIKSSGNVRIDFTLESVPEEAVLAFDIRFEPRTV